MSESQEWTVGKLLTVTTEYLQKHGAENPRLDAEILLAHARQCERILLYASFTEPVSDDLRAKFRELVKGRAAGKPVAYLVGKKEFFSLPFRVTEDVLIPRPETEFLVLGAVDFLKTRPNAQVIDIGTGSGAVAVSIAKQVPSCRVTATDISPAALEVAKANAAALGVGDRVDFRSGDLLAAFPPQPTFDVIVSNPPYIGEREKPTLSPQVRDHEPSLALFGGETGLEITARLIPQAAERLLPGGLLLIEISSLLEKETRALVDGDPRWKDVSVTKDYSGAPRVLRASRASA